MLYEYSEKRFIGVTDTNNSNKLSSYNIKAGVSIIAHIYLFCLFASK